MQHICFSSTIPKLIPHNRQPFDENFLDTLVKKTQHYDMRYIISYKTKTVKASTEQINNLNVDNVYLQPLQMLFRNKVLNVFNAAEFLELKFYVSDNTVDLTKPRYIRLSRTNTYVSIGRYFQKGSHVPQYIYRSTIFNEPLEDHIIPTYSRYTTTSLRNKVSCKALMIDLTTMFMQVKGENLFLGEVLGDLAILYPEDLDAYLNYLVTFAQNKGIRIDLTHSTDLCFKIFNANREIRSKLSVEQINELMQDYNNKLIVTPNLGVLKNEYKIVTYNILQSNIGGGRTKEGEYKKINKTIHLLGRKRAIYVSNRCHYIKVKGTFVRVSEARKYSNN